jgi:cullin 4
VLLPIAEEEDMIPQLLAFKSFVDSLLVAAFREDAKVQYDDSAPVKQESDKGKKATLSSSSRQLRTSEKKLGKGPFGYAATDAFAKGFGKRQRKPAEMIGLFYFSTRCLGCSMLNNVMLAKFIDKAMRKGQKDRSDDEFEEKLNAVLALYQFTKGV